MQGARETTADEAGDEENAVAIFVGRVLGAFVTMVILSILVMVMIALAYFSKHALPPTAHPLPAGQTAAAVVQRP